MGVHGPAHACASGSAISMRPRSRRWTRSEFVAVCCAKPAIHRFPAVMGRRIHGMCVVLADRYDGQPEQLWAEAATGAELFDRLARAARLRRGEGADLRGAARQALRRPPTGLGAGGRSLRRRRATHDRRLPRSGVAGAGAGVEAHPARGEEGQAGPRPSASGPVEFALPGTPQPRAVARRRGRPPMPWHAPHAVGA